MKISLACLLLTLSISGCEYKYNLQRNPDAWKDWDYSVHGKSSDGHTVEGDMTMDSKGALTGAGLIRDENEVETDITVRKISDSQMDGIDKNGVTYKLTIDPLRAGEPPHQTAPK